MSDSSCHTIINFFIREEPFGFLSNFERTPIKIMVRWGTVTYPTNEHYYQAQKANNEEVHDWIAWAPHARLAMVSGRQLEHNKYLKDKFMVSDWENKKVDVMLEGLRVKFTNPKLRKMLLDTGDAILHEDNPEDFYWGIGDGTGKSVLGKLLMKVRQEVYDSSHTKVTENGEQE